MRCWLERIGLQEVWQKTFLMEHWGSDMTPASRSFIRSLMTNRARIAQEQDLPEEDKAWWRTVLDDDSPDNPMNHPDFHWCEANTLAVGRVGKIES